MISNTTEAFVGNGANVQAKKDVLVIAHAEEDLLSVAAGLAVSGGVSLAGGVSVLSIDNTTRAYIGDNATVVADANVLVAAGDDTDVTMIAGAAGIGIGLGGAAGSVGVVTITKDTRAWIGSGAAVDGKGHQAGLAGIFSGLIQQDAFATETLHGVAVQAASSEQVFDLAVAGAGGLFVGLAGGVTVTLLDSEHDCVRGAGARRSIWTRRT